IRSGYRLADAELREIDEKGDTRYFLNNLFGEVENGHLTRAWGSQRDITERRKFEDALRKSEERFRLLVENSSELISILESDGIIRYQSPSAERVLGYKAEYLVGKSVFDFIHPDDLERIIKTFTDWLGIPGFALPVECRFLHRDGSWRILEAIGNNL